jgi:hypothetical protein
LSLEGVKKLDYENGYLLMCAKLLSGWRGVGERSNRISLLPIVNFVMRSLAIFLAAGVWISR